MELSCDASFRAGRSCGSGAFDVIVAETADSPSASALITLVESAR
jgi:hypothetical protein